MNIIFFSDIHGNKYVLEPLLEAIKKEHADKVVFCGDIFGYYYHQDEIIDVFRRKGYLLLLGNHDKNFLDILDNSIDQKVLIEKYGNSYRAIQERISNRNIEFLRGLKPYCELKIDKLKIGIFHGSPYDCLNGRIYPDTTILETEKYNQYDFVVLGHTHHKMVKKVGLTTILNPGSIGQQRDGKGCSYLVLNTKDGSFKFETVEYAIDRLISDIEKYDYGNRKLKEVLKRKGGNI